MRQVATHYAVTVRLMVNLNQGHKKQVPSKQLFPHIFIVTVSFFLFVPFAFAQKGTVTGTVRGVDGTLRAATVTAGKTSALTDNNGRFSISLNTGNHTLVIIHTGYKEMMQELTITNGDTTNVEASLTATAELDEVVVLGSRSLVQRSNLAAAVPVDVFSAKQLAQTGQVSLTQMLNYSAPSFNASRPHNNEPVTLRGLSPDQLLILVNGTRRHSMGIITASGARGQLGGGTAPNDLNSIPFTAIEKIEILRDGAAAQYGSDAIAGIINIHLKKSTGNTSVQLQTGQL